MKGRCVKVVFTVSIISFILAHTLGNRVLYHILQIPSICIQAMIDARVQQNMTQKDLSARTEITLADISRIENGTRNPSLNMVKKLAQGLGMQLKLEFIPKPVKK